MSLAATTSAIPSNATDALFRTWGSGVSAQLAAAGWVQTADAGQINWTTVTAPVGTATAQGYEVWRMADALQATVPIFLKIEFGSGAAATSPAVWITLGDGSNGAGALTGVQSVRQIASATLVATAVTWYWSGDTDRFAMVVVGTGTPTSWLFSIERTVDASGARTGEGALLVVRSASVWSQAAWNQVTGPCTATWEITIGAMGPSLAPAGVFGTQVAVYPIYHHKGIYLNPGLNCLSYIEATMSPLSPITFDWYGAPHTYLPLGTFFPNPFRTAPVSPGSLLVRYE